MPPRFYMDGPLHAGEPLALPAVTARHVQVLRLQPGAPIVLFNGAGGEWHATVAQMGRSDVTVQIGTHVDVDRELALPVTLALGMPANDRMDALVEKATELGVAVIQPLLCERSVLRLAGERAQKKVAHWQAVALAACEQSARTRVPQIAPVSTLADWLRQTAPNDAARWLLSLDEGSAPTTATAPPPAGVVCLSGPEGGLAPAEECAARAAGFAPVSLGPRVLRADTAPLALLAHLALSRSSRSV
ncbi:MAG TPA: 16S rRNA (uracil(1498)-N(3))-methyltransferase [Burkholderiaceae bacterium]